MAVHYIKLGGGKDGETITKPCIDHGVLWLGYTEDVSDAVIALSLANEKNNPNTDWQTNWSPVRASFPIQTEQKKTDYTRQIRIFYTADSTDYFFTFYNNRMWYCNPVGDTYDGRSTVHYRDSRLRDTVDGWHDFVISPSQSKLVLREHVLSGMLLKSKMYRGTICTLGSKEEHIFFNTLRWDFPEYVELQSAQKNVIEQLKKVIRLLSPHDFEMFTDLVFAKAGWLRIGEMGGTVKAIDMEYEIPITHEHVWVQVKSSLSTAGYEEATKSLDMLAEGLDRKVTCYVVFHSSNLDKASLNTSFTNIQVNILDCDDLALLCQHQEIISWLFLKTLGMNQ